MKTMSPFMKALIVGVLFALTILAGQYVNTVVVNRGDFRPDWIIVGAAGLMALVFELVRERYVGNR